MRALIVAQLWGESLVGAICVSSDRGLFRIDEAPKFPVFDLEERIVFIGSRLDTHRVTVNPGWPIYEDDNLDFKYSHAKDWEELVEQHEAPREH